ncbi:helix-turn-helix domain-containing protein [Micromonospora sp. NBC_01796]|uniref:helix-turn-helix domain-containing protein n=1 Tax=Micromonospora sp. NBC_01796 TaxID=2975987 RepID=UPI002DD94CFB|nr:helix-turn-helix domain-containing protein [Micromonospora sp. NBC_01796]WSA89675.1 helix-turn-helix domain-containing protein [Micromonospora sp. NBC_01796]
MDELPIGRRVAYWRGQRKMSQQVFADRIGRSKSWVDKVERGDRRLDKFSMLYQIAVVLQIDVAMLLNRDPERGSSPSGSYDQRELDDLRQALERSAPVAPLGRAPATPLHELAQSVNHAWLTYQYARYGVLVRGLPGLLRDAQAADAYHRGDAGRQAASLLGQVLQIASSALRKFGECDLARLAADRAIGTARRAEDDLLAAVATSRMANALLAMGRARPAFEANMVMAHRLAPTDLGTADPAHLSVYGSLLLQAAMAAARLGDNAGVHDLFRGADEAAKMLGGDRNEYWTSFGPTNVELHRAAAAVELGDGRQAVSIHAHQLNHRALAGLLPERRAHHLLDLARGYLLVGETGCAGEALVEADRVAPWEIRGRPIAHELMADILRRTKGTAPALVTELATQMGARV